MGNFEKLVVLTVLFVAAIVLAIAFNRGGDEVEAANPLSGAQHAALQETSRKADPSSAAAAQQPKSSLPGPEGLPAAKDPAPGTSLLLSAGAEAEPTSAPDATPPVTEGSARVGLSVEPERDPTRRILRDTNGLRPSFAEDYMVYTAVAGDTWSGLAQRFYQDGRYTRNLHQANDDLTELESGSSILVPVYDFLSSDAGGAATTATAAAPADREASAKPAPGARPPAGATTQPGTAAQLEYQVQSGDTLSDISLAVFGTATRWKEIFDANRAVLKKPEWLQVGMKLKIPAGGKLPDSKAAASATKDARTSEAKPKTAAAATNPAPKKKKVQ